MDHIDFVDNIQPDPVNYDDELYEYDHDVARVSRSLFLELTDKKTLRGVDQRKHKRFQVNKDAFALVRPAAAEELCVADRNMAEIACAVYRSKPVRFGRIDNISMGGLSFRYIAGEKRCDPSLVLDILVAESGFYLDNLMYNNISDFEMDDEIANNSFKMRLSRMKFEGLEPAAIMKLKYFIENYSVSGV